MPKPKPPTMAGAIRLDRELSPEVEAARESIKKIDVDLIRFSADVPADIQARAMAKMKMERKTARELTAKWLLQYINGDWSDD